MERNYTTGSVFKNILIFSLPYLFSYFLQTLYGMADLFIIGQFEGVASTTAVSIGSQVMHMLTVMIVGLAMGATVSIGQATGANNRKEAASDIGNTVTLFLLLSLVLTVVLLLLVKPVVSIMSTPSEAVNGTIAYLTICFIGIPFITAYNIISSILRGYIWDCFFAGIHFSFSGYFCACEKSGISFLHNIIAIVLMRVPGVYLTSKLFPATLLPMGLATAAGSLVSVIICVIAYCVMECKAGRKPVNH